MIFEKKVKKSKKINIFNEIYHFDPPPRGRKVEKSKKFSKIDLFDYPRRGREVEKSKKFNILSKIDHFAHQQVEKSISRKNSMYPGKSISVTVQQEVEKSKKFNILSKSDNFDLPPRGRKVEK